MAPTVSYDRVDESYTFGELNSISNLIKLDSEPPQGSDPNQKFTIPSDAFDHSERCVKILEELDDLMNLSQSQKQGQVTRGVVLDGYHLSPTEVVANARWVFNFSLLQRSGDCAHVFIHNIKTNKQWEPFRYGVEPVISSDQALVDRIAESVAFLDSKLDTAIYGVTTWVKDDLNINHSVSHWLIESIWFQNQYWWSKRIWGKFDQCLLKPWKKKKKTKYIWFKPSDLTGWSLHLNQGSADTRSDSPGKLQIAFLEHQISGILPLTKPKGTSLGRIRYLTDPMDNIIPEPITRGAILIRINSLVRSVHNLNLEVGNHSKGRHSHSDRKICTLWSWFCFQRSFCCQIRGLGDFGISVE